MLIGGGPSSVPEHLREYLIKQRGKHDLQGTTIEIHTK